MSQGTILNTDSLNEMRYQVFEGDDENVINELNDIDPDLRFYNRIKSTLSCKYFSEDSLKRRVEEPNSPPCFSLIHSNVRSFNANALDLFTMLDIPNIQFQVICLSETWFDDNSAKCASLRGYAHIDRVRENSKGGGVSIFIKEGLIYNVRSDLSIMRPFAESVFIEIDRCSTGTDSNVIVGCLYRPPKSSISDFNSYMRTVVSALSQEKKRIYLAGDFNINLLKADQHLPSSEFVEQMFEYSLFPLMNIPTRITKTSATLIDNIFTNNLDSKIYASGVLTNPISDHCPVFCMTEVNLLPKSDDKYIIKRVFSERNKAAFVEALSNAHWSGSYADNCQIAFTSFYEVFKKCFDGCFPVVRVKAGYKTRKVWLTDSLKASISNKNRLYRKFLKSKSDHALVQYKNYKRILQRALRDAERKHYDDLFVHHKNNLRKSWELIKDIIGKNKSAGMTYRLEINGREVNDPVEIAEAFNDYFVNVGPTLANNIPPTNINPLHSVQTSDGSFFLTPTDSLEVTDIVRNLKDGSPGGDGITAECLKNTMPILVNQLVHIFNLSFEQGIFPVELKVAKVIPLFKSGDHKMLSNYRPIS